MATCRQVKLLVAIGLLLAGACAGGSLDVPEAVSGDAGHAASDGPVSPGWNGVPAPSPPSSPDSGPLPGECELVLGTDGEQCLMRTAGCTNGDTEPNDQPASATPILLTQNAVLSYQAQGGITTCLSEEDEDWLLVPTRELLYQRENLEVTLLLDKAFWCSCSQDSRLCAVEPHAVGLEIYDTASMTLQVSEVSETGRIRVDYRDVPEQSDVLVRVYAPGLGSYDYGIYFNLQADGGGWEDECEC